MLELKDKSVEHAGLQPEIYFALGVASAIRRVLFGEDSVVTSLLDGQHNCGSVCTPRAWPPIYEPAT
jgi:hypothetical protein